MICRSLQNVSVWFDRSSKDEGAFAEGLEWACRLSLPVRVVVNRAPAPDTAKMKRWESACTLRGISVDWAFSGDSETGIEQFLRPYSLCAFENDRTNEVRQRLLARSMQAKEILTLLTPPVSRPLTRILIIYHQDVPDALFVESAIRFCKALDVSPVVLTVASSEKEARLKQSFAEGVCASLSWRVDFDSVVTHDVQTAVERIAGWRNCGHALFQHSGNISSNYLASRETKGMVALLRNLSDKLALLAFSETLTMDLALMLRDNCLARVDGYPLVGGLT